ncbi:transposase [Cupriavidus pauculus]|uniref:Transposase n=1 Tax=Cupriavidus pauculus TaxID=82633 RepID=A0A5P2H5T1_9BURK|nr:transposase [Cupriavidus pauculus]
MKKRFTEEQIIGVLKEAEAGLRPAELCRTMDFVSDGLAHGRRFRCLNVVDDYTRECLAIEVDTRKTNATQWVALV